MTGISTPVGGVTVEYLDSERELIRRFFVFLEDRFIVSAAAKGWDPAELKIRVMVSAQRVTEEATRLLQELPEDSPGTRPLRRIRLDLAGRTHDAGHPSLREVEYALEILRERLGTHVATLAQSYDLEVRQPLRSWLPGREKPSIVIIDHDGDPG